MASGQEPTPKRKGAKRRANELTVAEARRRERIEHGLLDPDRRADMELSRNCEAWLQEREAKEDRSTQRNRFVVSRKRAAWVHRMPEPNPAHSLLAAFMREIVLEARRRYLVWDSKLDEDERGRL